MKFIEIMINLSAREGIIMMEFLEQLEWIVGITFCRSDIKMHKSA